MIKSILHKDWHQIQTSFGILNCFYSTIEFNAILLIKQKPYKADILPTSSKSFFLYTIAEKITTNNKVAVYYNYKKLYTIYLRYKYWKKLCKIIIVLL